MTIDDEFIQQLRASLHRAVDGAEPRPDLLARVAADLEPSPRRFVPRVRTRVLAAAVAAPVRSPRVLARGLALTALAVGSVAAVTLGTTGVFSGNGPGSVQPAAAAVMRRAAAALETPPGTILDQTMTVTMNFAANGGGASHTSKERVITETPQGAGPSTVLRIRESGPDTGVEILTAHGETELYDPSTNTIYFDSEFGDNITAGPTPGTYTYTQPSPTPGSGPKIPGVTPGPPASIQISAAQAAALRDGTDEPNITGPASNPHIEIRPATPATSETDMIRALLTAGKLKFVGPTMIGGRRVLKLTSKDGAEHYYVAPDTYQPIEYDDSGYAGPGGYGTTTTTYDNYQMLPATVGNEQLLSISAGHPSATRDYSKADFQRAMARVNADG